MQFEEALIQQLSVSNWARYLAHHQESPPQHRFWLFSRATKAIPGSYKLWHAYTDARTKYVTRQGLQESIEWSNQASQDCNQVFEDALYLLNKVWIVYYTLSPNGQAV